MAGQLRLLNGMALISWEMRATTFTLAVTINIGRVRACEWEVTLVLR